MRIATRDLQVVTAGLVSAVLLAACSGNSSKPTVLPPLTTSATPAAATTPAPAPTTTSAPAPATSAVSPVATPTSAAPTPSPTATSASAPNPSQGDPAVAAKMIAVVKAYYVLADAAPHNAALLPKWRAKFANSCGQCLAEYNVIKKEVGLGTKYIGGGYSVRSLRAISWDNQFGHIGITFYAEAGKAYDKTGKLIDSVGRSKLRSATVAVQQQGGNWFVVFYEEAIS